MIETDTSCLPEGLSITPLKWKDQQPGSRGQIRLQSDEQIEFYTICGRYIIRAREGINGMMWVLRYLEATPVMASSNLSECRRAADEHLKMIVLADLGLIPSPYMALGAKTES